MEINTERRVGRSTILHLDQAKTRSKIGIYRFEVAPRQMTDLLRAPTRLPDL